MRNTIIAIATLIAGSAVAADLPSRSAPPAPVVQAPVSWYVGLNGGTIAGNSGTVGVNGGLQYGQYVRVEGAYDYANTGGGNLLGQNTNLLTGNFIVQYPVDQFKVTPYALAGAGYRWSSVKNEPRKFSPLRCSTITAGFSTCNKTPASAVTMLNYRSRTFCCLVQQVAAKRTSHKRWPAC